MSGTEVPAALVEVADRLRSAGVKVPTSSVLAWAEALAVLGGESRDAVVRAGRLTLVHRREDRDTFDRMVAELIPPVSCQPEATADRRRPPAPSESAGGREVASPPSDGPRGPGLLDPSDAPAADGHDRGGAPDARAAWSRRERLRHLDMSACSATELAEIGEAIDRLDLSGPLRRSRRTAPGPSGPIDLRRTVRRAVRSGGEPLPGPRRSPRTRTRRAVLLLDVSGSMEPWAAPLLRFAHAAVRSQRPVEVFAFATRLTRLTRELGGRDADAALARAVSTAPDLAGGTRLGDVLAEFNDRWGVRGVARGADVVVVSDGWDRGAGRDVAEQMARLHRVAHRVTWVNPLKASPGYEPLARGMAAALPWVDRFEEGHSLASLEALVDVLATDRAAA